MGRICGRQDPLYLMDGRKITSIREKTGLRKKDFAIRIGATPGSVTRWENGQNKVTIDYWSGPIKTAFGIDIRESVAHG